jgi:hypothetical protein
MKDLDLTPEQAAAFAREGGVERWVRMEPQPEHRHGRVYQHKGTIGNMLMIATKHAPHPPGTRAMVQTGTPTQVGGVTVRIGAIIRATLTTVKPEQRDGVWGWVERWEKA